MHTKSVRLPSPVIEEVDRLRGTRRFSQVLAEAVEQWIKRVRRQREDEAIARSLAGRSPDQRDEEAALLDVAAESGLRALESLDG